jgi:tyrosine-protein kinase Etk/Wzc
MTTPDVPAGQPRNFAPSSKSALFLTVFWTWRRFLIINVLAATLIALIISLILPKWYRATASLLPPKQPDLFGSLGTTGSMLRSLTGAARLGGFGQKPAAYNYFAVLHSRTAMEDVVSRFDLIHVYDVPDSSMEKAIKELESNTEFSEQIDENITIEVLDRDPARAAAMANYFVDVLNRLSIELGTREARTNREFIEKRLLQAQHDLASAEDSLKAYQETSGVIITPEQASSVSMVAALYAMKAKKELEVAVAERSTTADNPMLQQLRTELDVMNRKLATMPQTGLQSFRLYRDVAIQQKIVEFLIPIHEQAKIDEQKDVPVLLVLDRAVVPEKKVRPQRLLIVTLAFFLSLFAFTVVTLMFHSVAHWDGTLSSPASSFRSWVLRVAARYKVLLR